MTPHPIRSILRISVAIYCIRAFDLRISMAIFRMAYLDCIRAFDLRISVDICWIAYLDCIRAFGYRLKNLEKRFAFYEFPSIKGMQSVTG